MTDPTLIESFRQVPLWVPIATLLLFAAVLKLAGGSWLGIGSIFGGAIAMFVGLVGAFISLVSGLVLLLSTLLGAPLQPELIGPWTDLVGLFIISMIGAMVGLQGGQLALAYGFQTIPATRIKAEADQTSD